MKKYIVLCITGLLIIAIIMGIGSSQVKHTAVTQGEDSKIQVVAAENFYGDIVSQLGGTHVQVLSILTDPNTDPHEYESSVQDGRAVANAAIIIENGDNYDTWMDKLLSASPKTSRTLLVGSQIADHKIQDNPHIWYGFDNMHTIAGKITDVLKQKDPVDARIFDQNLTTFDNSLQELEQKISEIKTSYTKIPVGLTETIYLYQALPEGLTVLTPLAFEKAIAEGNDPSARDVVTANDQLTKKQIKVLIYNMQTVTPITTNLENEAKQFNIPIVPVTETMPKGKTYQTWMMDQLIILEKALQTTQ